MKVKKIGSMKKLDKKKTMSMEFDLEEYWQWFHPLFYFNEKNLL